MLLEHPMALLQRTAGQRQRQLELPHALSQNGVALVLLAHQLLQQRSALRLDAQLPLELLHSLRCEALCQIVRWRHLRVHRGSIPLAKPTRGQERLPGLLPLLQPVLMCGKLRQLLLPWLEPALWRHLLLLPRL